MVTPEASAPIGVFDSGIGGLTVVRELVRQLPAERIIYFGDTARVPYGSKSPETVQRYSREITGWLRGEGVKAIVVACNTATAHSLGALRAENDLPIIGVVEPGARAAVRATNSGRIGVIGTMGTINSGAYERAIRQIDPGATITTRACPLLVPLVEEGWLDAEPTRQIARYYLEPLIGAHVDSLVLGCTHYPLLKPLLTEIMGPAVRLIDSAEETAAETGRVLRQRSLTLADSGAAAPHRFVVSDLPQQFLQLGKRFLGEAVEHVELLPVG